MLSTLVASAGLFVCQEAVQFEESVVSHLDASQWVFERPTDCTALTLLSPDLSQAVKLASPDVDVETKSSGGSTPVSPVAGGPQVNIYQCKPTYQVKTVQVAISASEGLAPAERAKLAELAAQGVSHIQLARYVAGDGEGRSQSVATVEDVKLVRTALEALVSSPLSISEEIKRVDGEALKSMRGRMVGVAAVIVKPCGERVRQSSPIRPFVPVSGPSSELKGGNHGVAPR
jgi:hypothetical protein